MLNLYYAVIAGMQTLLLLLGSATPSNYFFGPPRHNLSLSPPKMHAGDDPIRPSKMCSLGVDPILKVIHFKRCPPNMSLVMMVMEAGSFSFLL